MIGPGKYDPEAMGLMETLKAVGVLVGIIGGTRGDGFSCVCTDSTAQLALPEILRRIAAQVEADNRHLFPGAFPPASLIPYTQKTCPHCDAPLPEYCPRCGRPIR